MGKPDSNNKTYPFETVAILVAVLKEHNINLGMKHFEAMADMDPDRTASGYEHAFRPLKARAQEILAARGGAGSTPGTPRSSAKGAKPKSAAKTASQKTSKKRVHGQEDEEPEFEGGVEEHLQKKIKAEPQDED